MMDVGTFLCLQAIFTVSLVSLLFQLKYSLSLNLKQTKINSPFHAKIASVKLLYGSVRIAGLSQPVSMTSQPKLVKFLFSDSKRRYSLGDLRGIAHHRVIKSYNVINDF